MAGQSSRHDHDPVTGKPTRPAPGSEDRSLGIPITDPRYSNLVSDGQLHVPIINTTLPATWTGADLVALLSGPQNAPVYTYYIWDGAAFQALGMAAGGPPNGPAGGDLSGAYPNPQVAKASGAFPVTGTLTANGTFIANGRTDINGVIRLNSVIQPTIAGATNDWNPAGMTTANAVYVTVNGGAQNLTGIVAAFNTELLVLINASANKLTLQHENGGSAAANRFRCEGGVDVVLNQNGIAYLWYNNTGSRWQVFAGVTDYSQLSGTPAALPPNGAAGGDLGGNYPNPTVAAIHETSGPTKLTAGTIADGEFLKRSGTALVSAALTQNYQTLDDEGTAITQRATADFIGVYTQAIDDAAGLSTRIRTGYAMQDAIVDSDAWVQLSSNAGAISGGVSTLTDAGQAWATNNWAGCRIIITGGTGAGQVRVISSNTATVVTVSVAWTVQPGASSTYIIQPSTPVYRRLQECIAGGHASILYRKASGEVDFTIAAGDSVVYILGDKAFGAAINISLTINKTGLLLQNLQFDGAGTQTTFGSLGVTAIGCVWGHVGAGTAALTMNAGSAIACVFIRSGATPSITVGGADCRVQACQFIGSAVANVAGVSGGHIFTSGVSATKLSVTGCLFVGVSETGYLIDVSLAGNATLNGNLFDIPVTALGAIYGGITVNISGNFFTFPGGGVTLNHIIINNCSRDVITGNTFNIGNTLSSTGSMKVIVEDPNTVGHLITGNAFVVFPISSTCGFSCMIQCGSVGGVIAGNLFNALSSSTGYWTGLNALTTGYSFTNNVFCFQSNAGSFNHWKPIHNSAGNPAIGAKSIIKGNLGLPDFLAYIAPFSEDFVAINAAQAAWNPAAANYSGWKQALTLLGAVTNVQDSQNGLVTLATGATILGGAVLWMDTNHIAVNTAGNAGGGIWQCSLPRISSVIAVRIHVGFMLRAGWLGLIAAGTWGAAGSLAGAAFTDWFAIELDTGLSGNWFLRWRKAGAETIFDTTITATATSTQLLMGVDNIGRPWAYVNGLFINPNAASTNVPVALVTIGAGIENLAGADKEMDIDMFAWGDDRV